ncbi:DUF6169 family protein [Parapedobacter koreensis]|uniref:Uncharacterized protein n=1 Tax=Parapedobacter koreensis TaxID=332977 RepID=A0A1H7UBM8_9SPHI|nr:DUF6169 family protein [Parapedobacter koreensis]SEL94085.1 hypothetical protein SAMN05421740_11468 [Parapedobacter koreensis]
MQSRYDYSFDEETLTYNFITKNNITYRVAFVADESLALINDTLFGNVYQIVIEKVTDSLEPLDNLVSKTVNAIIVRFFENAEQSLLYVCSDNEHKAEIRYRTFDRWYKNSDYKEYIVKVDNPMSYVIAGQSYKLYTSLLYHKDHPSIHSILDVYSQLETALNAEK